MKIAIKNIVLAFSLLGFVSLTACGQTENTQNEEKTIKLEKEVKIALANPDNPFQGFNLADHSYEMSVAEWGKLSTEAKAKFAREKKAEKAALANFDFTTKSLTKEQWEGLSVQMQLSLAGPEIQSVAAANGRKEIEKMKKESNKLDNEIAFKTDRNNALKEQKGDN